MSSRRPLAWGWLGGVLLVGALAGWLLGSRLPTRPAPLPAPVRATTAATRDAIVVTDQAEPPNATPVLLPTTATQLHCFFRLERLPAGTPLQAQWKLGAQPLGALEPQDLRLDRQAYLAGRFTFGPPTGQPSFPPGIYQLILRSGDQVLIETSFVVAQEAEKILAQQPPAAGELRVVNLGLFGSLGSQGQPQQPSKVFPPTAKIHAVFTYLNGVAGQKLLVRWYAAGVEIPQARQEVAVQSGARQAYAWLQAKGAGLPEGVYQVGLYLPGRDQSLVSADFTIKAGTVLPPATPSTSSARGHTP